MISHFTGQWRRGVCGRELLGVGEGRRGGDGPAGFVDDPCQSTNDELLLDGKSPRISCNLTTSKSSIWVGRTVSIP